MQFPLNPKRVTVLDDEGLLLAAQKIDFEDQQHLKEKFGRWLWRRYDRVSFKNTGCTFGESMLGKRPAFLQARGNHLLDVTHSAFVTLAFGGSSSC